MGISSSALPEVAVLAVRATGPALATSAFINGRYGYAWALWALAHFVILMTLGIPALATGEATYAALVTYPLIALGAAVLSMFNFYLLRLAELLPLTRTLGRSCGMNFGPKASGGFILAHLLVWLVVAVGADFAFEWFYASDLVLGLVLELVLIVVGYALALLLNLFLFNRELAVFGGDESAIVRSILVPGIYHLVVELVVGLVIVFTADQNWAWISAVVVLGVGLLVTIAIWFLAASAWKRLPRTGDLTTFANLPADKTAIAQMTSPAAEEEDVPLEEGTEETATDGMYKSRFGVAAPVFRTNASATAPLFNAKQS
jgi:hypothetical protein